MTTIFKDGIKSILKVFYDNNNQATHLRELSRLTNLHGQSITRYLNILEKENVLEFEKIANLKNFQLKLSNKTAILRSFFDMEIFEKISQIKKQAIKLFLQELTEKPVIVLLFGSTAKLSYKKNSDIDLILIVNKKIDTSKAEKFADSQTAQIINSIQIEVDVFKRELRLKEDFVIQSALETGFPITNHIYYYELLDNENLQHKQIFRQSRLSR